MSRASVLTIRIPSDLKHRIELVAEEQGVSINQLAMYMFTKEIGNLEASQTMSKYWKNYPKEKILTDFDNVMEKVKDKPVPDWDKIDNNSTC
ncbi:toxin-antitoxin system HicB family antitoxin [candidate division KSB1 bacterium]|nr:toxin-antitoxin system HicB family antitoxin [candidate division KSB1 bacterium]